jgi:peptidylprolyl isomerase
MTLRTLSRRRAVALVAVPLAAALTLTACGGSDSGDEGSTPSSSSSAAPAGDWVTTDCATIAPPATANEPPADSIVEGEVAVTTAAGVAPTVGIEAAAGNVTSLVNVDIAEGAGEAVQAGAEVTVEYCGIGMVSKAIFDSSWARGSSITFPLAGVIAGWQEGLPGMKPGGRRLLIIPADMAYGDNPPAGSGIEAGESLLFVVDLISSP